MSTHSFIRGYACPQCDGDTDIFYDRRSGTCGWICPKDDCQAVGFGFRGRRSARIGLRKYRERFGDQQQEFR